MEYNEIQGIVKNYVMSVRALNQIEKNPYHFKVIYHALKSDSSIVESPSESIFKDFEWGVIRVIWFWSSNEGDMDTQFITKDGIITPKLKFGSLTLHDDFHITTTEQIEIYWPNDSNWPIEKKINEIMQIVPLLQECKTREEAKKIVEIVRNKPAISTKEDVVKSLMSEIKELKSIVRSYENMYGTLSKKQIVD